MLSKVCGDYLSVLRALLSDINYCFQIVALSALVAFVQAGLLDVGHATSYSTAHLAAPVLSHGYAAAPVVSHAYAAPVIAHGYAAPSHVGHSVDYHVSSHDEFSSIMIKITIM